MLADDHGGAQRGDGHRALGEDAAGLVAALQVMGELGVIVTETAQIDDLLHARLCSGPRRVARGHAVELGEVPTGTHRVHQPVDDVESCKGAVKRLAVQRVRLRDLDVGHLLEVGVGPSHDRADLRTLIAQLGDDAAPDVA